MSALCRVVATVASLAVALAALVRLDSGPLRTPPVGSWAAVSRWYSEVGPDVAVVAGLRLAALGLAAWLLVATVLQVLRSVPALGPVGALADLISPRSLQRLGHGLAGLSLTAGLAAPAPSAGVLEPPVPPAPPAVPTWPADAEAPAGTATMHLVVEAPVAEERADPPAPSVAPALRPATVVATPGDSLWSIAAEELAADAGASPPEQEVVRYWHQLIDANRAVLVDPANPDLIYAGQEFTLP